MPRTGRISKLTADVQERVCAALREGMTRKLAALHAGISRATLLAWMARGRAKVEGPFHDFLGAVRKAEAEAHVRCLAQISRASRKDWRAAAWLLERRFPRRYGRPAARPATPPPQVNVGVQVDLAPYAEMIRRLPADLLPEPPALPKPS